MGRPLNKRFLEKALAGSRIAAATNADVTEPGVASITVVELGSGYTVATVSIAAPISGTTATATATIVGGEVTGYVITNAGSGYKKVPKVTVSGDGTGAKGTAVLAAGTSNTGYLVSQRSTSTFFVQIGATQVSAALSDKVAATLVDGEVSVIATHATAGTFPVRKITNRFVYDFNGNKYTWSFAAAAGNMVQLASA